MRIVVRNVKHALIITRNGLLQSIGSLDNSMAGAVWYALTILGSVFMVGQCTKA